MPPRRRKAEGTSAAEPKAKKSRTSLEVDGCTVQWEWEDDKGKWTAYSEEFAGIITDSYNNSSKDVSFDVAPSVQIKVIFDRMVQKNKKTGWERRLRCGVKAKGEDDFHIWQWEDENKRWNPYNMAATVSLEKARSAGDEEVALKAYNRDYTINVTKLEQVNDDTGVTRRVERVKIDTVTLSTEVTGAASSAASTSKADEGEKVTTSRGKGRSAKGSTGRGKSAGTKATGPEEEGDGDKSVKTIVVTKGGTPVDAECPKANSAHVYTKGKDIYDAMLNQTNLSNNNNKYYLMQVLEDDKRKVYSVWFRWGRVGYPGQTTLVPCGSDIESAKRQFTKKFQDKTRNNWNSRATFQKLAGKYDWVKVDYSADSSKDEDKPKAKKPENVPDSKLEKHLQSLIDLICDVKSMEAAVVEMKYDAKKAPLGKLTETQIKAGYAALKKIDACIDKNEMGAKLIQGCDEFYTRIPHDFGMRTPPVIRTKAEVKLKISLLEALSDIEVAMKIIKEIKIDENPLDTHYNSLKCNLKALAKTSGDYQMVEDYLQNTHASTHNQYKMEITDIFDVDKTVQSTKFEDNGNRMLLWHGSRLTNWVGILSQGLRIAPPEAPVTGYMFGKGVYFADMSSKSANYCYPSASNTEGLLLLCEVSLGKCNELLSADYNAASLPDGTHSVMGMGAIAPDPKKNFKMSNGCIVPMGKSTKTGVTNPSGYTLNYNEFIVYKLKQIKMKYLLRVKFNFK